jgi:hypothetical protein
MTSTLLEWLTAIHELTGYELLGVVGAAAAFGVAALGRTLLWQARHDREDRKRDEQIRNLDKALRVFSDQISTLEVGAYEDHQRINALQCDVGQVVHGGVKLGVFPASVN